MSKKVVLVTGVAGLLGSRLADWIINNTDYKVVGVDDLSGGYIENIPKGVKFYKFDLKSLNRVDSLFDAINVKDNKRPKKDKEIWKVLVFSTITFMIYTMTEHNNIGYKPNGWNGK